MKECREKDPIGQMKRNCGFEVNEEETLARLVKINHCIDALADFRRNSMNMRGREITAIEGH